jgi:hypothetical protein
MLSMNQPIDEQDQVIATLAAAMIASFEKAGINPDPQVWQLISDRQLEQVLGRATFDVLQRRRETMIQWMTLILDAQ